MKKHSFNNIKNNLPYFGFSVITGILSAICITAFKLVAERVIHLCANLYEYVRQNPVWLPIFIIGVALLGLAAGFILSASRSSRGGGVPASIAAIRGIEDFKWKESLFVLPFSAFITFLSGIPLGTEGPCVQMGTAIGDGVVKCFGSKKHSGYRHYLMNGGASAGFCVATASPITAIFFSIEELQKRFSPLLVAGTSISILTAQIIVKILASFGIGSDKFFHIPEINAISPKLLFAPLMIGIICGICSVLFTHFHHLINKLMHALLNKLSIKVFYPLLFGLVSITGFFFADTLGTGHSLIENLYTTPTVWYMLIFVLLIRAIVMMFSNTSGVTGGMFLPNLAFGAIIGSLCADAMIALEILEPQHYTLMIVLGITAFLGATSRIPLTACIFAVEAMGGINNIPAVIIATAVAFVLAKLSKVEDLTDAILHEKKHSATQSTTPEHNTINI